MTDLLQYSNETILKASEVIKNGGLVAFPTETVYGLGANGLDSVAVKKIYEAKGRPSDNPMILHIASIEDLYPLVCNVSKTSMLLMEKFWPGPLTLVFNKSDIVPMVTSGGLNTVAIRFPSDKIACELIRKASCPIAAPSANSSGKPSPTQANHVFYDLKDKVDLIIDGGNTLFGLESTILDVSDTKPCLLRPGSITKEMIEEVVGEIDVDKSILDKIGVFDKPKAPGMKYTHYSPLAEVYIALGDVSEITTIINEEIKKNDETDPKKIGILATEQTKHLYDEKYILISLGDRNDLNSISHNLFNALRKFDYLGVNIVFSESFEEKGIGLAIMNRLKKSAGYKFIKR